MADAGGQRPLPRLGDRRRRRPPFAPVLRPPAGDGKGSAQLEPITATALESYAEIGWTLAKGHARSGDRFTLAGYLGKGDAFDRALVRFATSYADQNERDHAALVQAVKDGRVPAERGV